MSLLSLKKTVIPIFILINWVFLYYYTRPFIEVYVSGGDAPVWIEKILNAYIPTSKDLERYSSQFWLSMADIAFIKSILFLLVSYLLWLKKSSVQLMLASLNQKTLPAVIYSAQRIYLLLLLIYSIYPYFFALDSYKSFSIYFKPIPPFWGQSYPNENIIFVLYLLLIASFIGFFIRKLRLWAWFILVTCFLYVQGVFLCFGKIDHTYAPLNGIFISSLFLFYESRHSKENYPYYPVLCMQLFLVGAYVFAGLEKLFLYPLHSSLVDSFKSYGLTALTQNDVDEYWLLLGALLIPIAQISVGTIWSLPRTGKIILLLLIALFHWIIYLLMGIGGWFHPYILAQGVFWLTIIPYDTKSECKKKGS